MPQPKRSHVMDGRQLCLACDTWKPIVEFWAGRTRCKPCLIEAQRAYRLRRFGPYEPKPLLSRLMDRSRVTDAGCWEWQGTVNRYGYGMISVGLRSATGNPRASKVHRVSWEMVRGAVPDGLELDHTCFNKRCWRIEHLEPVTRSENSRRQRLRELATGGLHGGRKAA